MLTFLFIGVVLFHRTLSLSDCEFESWRNGMEDEFFPCAVLVENRNCDGGGLYTRVNTALADLSETSTTSGVHNFNDKFLSGFVRPGCRLDMWTDHSFEGQHFTSGFNNSFEFVDNTEFSSLKCSCPVSDKDVLSCVPTMEWVALAECESNETHSTTCGFTATSKVLSYGQDSVEDPLKETLYDIARYYSANPLHKPTDETEWYQFRDHRVSRRFKVEQQVARCGHYEVHLRVFNVTIAYTDGYVNNWIWTAPSTSERTSDTSADATTGVSGLSTFAFTTEAIIDHTASSQSTTDDGDVGSTAKPAAEAASTNPKNFFSAASPIASESSTVSTSSLNVLTSTDGLETIAATFPTSSSPTSASSTTASLWDTSRGESDNSSAGDHDFADAALDADITDTVTSEPTDMKTSNVHVMDMNTTASSSVTLATYDVFFMALILVCTLAVVSGCIGLVAWAYRRRKKTGRYDVALVRFSATSRSVHIASQRSEENLDGNHKTDSLIASHSNVSSNCNI